MVQVRTSFTHYLGPNLIRINLFYRKYQQMLKRKISSNATAVSTNPTTQRLSGVVTLHQKGFGFVDVAGVSYFLPDTLARYVLTGDVVDVLVSAGGVNIKSFVLQITYVRRKAQCLMCEVHQRTDSWVLIPDEPCFVLLDFQGSTSDLAIGTVLAVEIPAYAGPVRATPIAVKALANIGPRGSTDFLEQYVKWRYGFQGILPGISELPAPNDEGRETLDLAFVTIDGESTLDLDDAIHVAPQGTGWQVHVAISDVSSVVVKDSIVDRVAAERGTSLYLPGQMVPMLPPALAAGICSLSPGGPRRAVILCLVLDENAKVLTQEVKRAWITSAARLSYAQVTSWLRGECGAYPVPVEANLSAMAQLYPVLRKNRDVRGMLDFEEPEPELVQLSDGGWRLVWESRTESHKLVEEFMLLANNVVAQILVQRYGVALLRHQAPPSSKDWSDFANWAKKVANQELPEKPCMCALATLSQQPDESKRAIVSQKIKTMMKPARYALSHTEQESGHFSLGLESYTHFTSPIRRYADLVIHRLLLRSGTTPLTQQEKLELSSIAENCTLRANAAKFAERYVWDQLKLKELMRDINPTVPLQVRIIRSSAHGLKVLIQEWQLMAWVPVAALVAEGFSWTGFNWEKNSSELAPGTLLTSTYFSSLNTSRAAYPEVLLTLRVV